VLAVAVCAVLAGARSMTAIAEWTADLPPEVREGLGVAAGPPCESTIRRVLGRLDGDGLDRVIGGWIAGQLTDRGGGPRRAVAVDGKTLRGTRTAPDQGGSRPALPLRS